MALDAFFLVQRKGVGPSNPCSATLDALQFDVPEWMVAAGFSRPRLIRGVGEVGLHRATGAFSCSAYCLTFVIGSWLSLAARRLRTGSESTRPDRTDGSGEKKQESWRRFGLLAIRGQTAGIRWCACAAIRKGLDMRIPSRTARPAIALEAQGWATAMLRVTARSSRLVMGPIWHPPCVALGLGAIAFRPWSETQPCPGQQPAWATTSVLLSPGERGRGKGRLHVADTAKPTKADVPHALR